MTRTRRHRGTCGGASAVAVTAVVAVVGGCQLDFSGLPQGGTTRKPAVSGQTKASPAPDGGSQSSSHTGSGTSASQTGTGSQSSVQAGGVVDASLESWGPPTPTVEVVR